MAKDLSEDEQWAILGKLRTKLLRKKDRTLAEERQLAQLHRDMARIEDGQKSSSSGGRSSAKEDKKAADAEKDAAEEREKAAEEEKEAAEEREDAAEDEEDAANAKKKNKKWSWGGSLSKRKSYRSGRPLFGGGSLFKSAGESGTAASMGLYYLLMILAGVAYYAKSFIGFEPTISFAISVVLFFVFFISIVHTKESKLKIVLIIMAFLIDIIVIFNLLERFSFGFAKNSDFLIVYVFAWPIVAILLFILGVMDKLKAEQNLSKFTTVVVIGIMAVILFMIFSLVLSSEALANNLPPVNQQEYKEASEKGIEKGKVAYEETKTTLGDTLGCIFQASAEPGKVDTARCQKEKKVRRYCEGIYKEDEEAKNNCVKDKLEGSSIAKTRKISTRDPVKLELKFDSAAYTDTFLDFGEEELSFPLIVKYKNPFKETIGVKASCNFTGILKNKGKSFVGTIKEADTTFDDENGEVNLECLPSEKLNGTYDLSFDVTFSDVKTDATLTRFFIGNKKVEDKKETLNMINKAESGSFFDSETTLDKMKQQLESKYGAASVPKDLVKLGFGMGSPTISNPIIENKELRLVYSAQNDGKGELLSINSYWTDLESFSAPCLSNENQINVPKRKLKEKSFTFAACKIETIPSELTSLDKDYERFTIRAFMTYDYLLKTKKRVDIVKID